MAKFYNSKQTITLLRLVLTSPESWFYPQDWYYDEEFANMPLDIGYHNVGELSTHDPENKYNGPSAVALAYVYVESRKWDYPTMFKSFMWTSDFDRDNNRVYVGGLDSSRRPGFQIHRHMLEVPNIKDIKYGYKA